MFRKYVCPFFTGWYNHKGMGCKVTSAIKWVYNTRSCDVFNRKYTVNGLLEFIIFSICLEQQARPGVNRPIPVFYIIIICRWRNVSRVTGETMTNNIHTWLMYKHIVQREWRKVLRRKFNNQKQPCGKIIFSI